MNLPPELTARIEATAEEIFSLFTSSADPLTINSIKVRLAILAEPLHKEIETLKSQFAEAKNGQEWQPIETAPREVIDAKSDIRRLGERILVWNGKAVIARWWHPQGYDGEWFGIKEGSKPTHWMPLPKPPTS